MLQILMLVIMGMIPVHKPHGTNPIVIRTNAVHASAAHSSGVNCSRARTLLSVRSQSA
jgi:hypothetical protein